MNEKMIMKNVFIAKFYIDNILTFLKKKYIESEFQNMPIFLVKLY